MLNRSFGTDGAQEHLLDPLTYAVDVAWRKAIVVVVAAEPPVGAAWETPGMGDEVRLRDVEEPDLEVFFEQQLDAEAARLANFPSRDRERFMTHWATRALGDPTVFVQTVTVDGQVAGNVVSWWDRDRRFVGYWLGRPFWGRGVGTRALRLFLQREQTRPLYADPFSGNTASVRLLERCGFERSGTVRYGQAEHIMLVLGAS